MKKYGIRANKSLGQNFLVDENVVEKIVEGADINKEDLIIEIGPGLGTLTKYLLEKAGKVICIELDKKMIKILNDRFYINNNFELII
jgi:16S rRNA (adenine1518-N6/adenine1519-N6)-dimethyltransferase